MLLNCRGCSWDEIGEQDRAIEDFTQAVRLDPSEPRAFLHRGRVWNDTGKYDKAIDDSSQAIRIVPKSPYGFHNRGSRPGSD